LYAFSDDTKQKSKLFFVHFAALHAPFAALFKAVPSACSLTRPFVDIEVQNNSSRTVILQASQANQSVAIIFKLPHS